MRAINSATTAMNDRERTTPAPGAPGAADAPRGSGDYLSPPEPQSAIIRAVTPPRPDAGLKRTEAERVGDLEPTLRVKNFDSWYGSFQAIKNVTMDMPKQRVTALIGPSGCGKSTFLRWINRMNDTVAGARAEGTLDLHGIDVLANSTDVVELRRRVGMVFQKPNPFPKSIYENVAYGPRLHMRMSKGDLDTLVERSLRGAALWNEVKDRLKSPGMSLSGGQQQRLCIARAIAVDPEVLLMDEPCSALDPKSTAAVEDLIDELRQQYTIVIVTHNMQQASRVSDFTAFFFTGNLVEFGPTVDLFTNPKKKETEDYITGRFG